MAPRRLLRRLRRHPRLYRWWYSRGLPWLIRRRALARAWCQRTRLGRLLFAPLPPWALLPLHYAAAVLVAAVGLAGVHALGLEYCRQPPDPSRLWDAQIGAGCRAGSPRWHYRRAALLAAQEDDGGNDAPSTHDE